MKFIALIVSAICTCAAMAQPTLEWTDFDRVTITGADYAFFEDDSGVSILNGVPLLGSMAWRDSDGILGYLIDPLTSYTIQAFSIDPTDPGNTDLRVQTTFTTTPSALDQLDYVVYKRILWEEKMSRLMAEHQYTFFEVSAAMQRMRARLIDEDFFPDEQPAD